MSVLQQLLPASFKGVSFYAINSVMESGRKQVTHEFPNSDRRFVEDLGRFQNVYKISALVTGSGLDYTANKNALVEVLEEGGIGLLVHPYYGTISVVAKQFSVQENITRVGEAIFDLTFEKSDPALVPIGNSINFSNLDILSDNLLSLLATNIGFGFSLFNNYPNNFLDAVSLISLIAGAFNINTRLFTQNRGFINIFSQLLNSYTSSANQLVTNPSELGNQTMNLFKETDNVVTAPEDKLTVYTKFYDFNDTQSRVPPTTFERIQRQNNRDILNDSIQAGALVQSYRAATQIEFTNVRELDQVQDTLETQYQKLANKDSLSDDVKLGLQDLRNDSRLFFEQEKLNVNQIDTIETFLQPLTVLTYQYYGDIDNVEKLVELNDVKNPSFVEGQIAILTG